MTTGSALGTRRYDEHDANALQQGDFLSTFLSFVPLFLNIPLLLRFFPPFHFHLFLIFPFPFFPSVDEIVRGCSVDCVHYYYVVCVLGWVGQVSKYQLLGLIACCGCEDS